MLEVPVALKVVRTHAAADADFGARANVDPDRAERLLRRFKHALLARRPAHKKVVRLNDDLGEIDGVMYIWMPCIQRSDLATILNRGTVVGRLRDQYRHPNSPPGLRRRTPRASFIGIWPTRGAVD